MPDARGDFLHREALGDQSLGFFQIQRVPLLEKGEPGYLLEAPVEIVGLVSSRACQVANRLRLAFISASEVDEFFDKCGHRAVLAGQNAQRAKLRIEDRQGRRGGHQSRFGRIRVFKAVELRHRVPYAGGLGLVQVREAELHRTFPFEVEGQTQRSPAARLAKAVHHSSGQEGDRTGENPVFGRRCQKCPSAREVAQNLTKFVPVHFKGVSLGKVLVEAHAAHPETG